MDLLAHSIAQAMVDYENEHRYELENGSQSTGVEPYEASAEDFEEMAAFVAKRLAGAVDLLREAQALIWHVSLSTDEQAEFSQRVDALLGPSTTGGQ